MKKSKKVIISLFIIVLVVSSIIALMIIFKPNKEEEIKIIKSINTYDYKLEENETKLYKDTFNELDGILSSEEVNYEDYAKCIAKLFIIDFYTLDNKLSKNDIGGTDFIKGEMRDNFIEEARSTFYKYLEQKEGREQTLPEVSEILSVELENTSFTYSDKTVDDDAYKITIKWDYKEDLGYETEANMIIVKEGKKLYIVEMD